MEHKFISGHLLLGKNSVYRVIGVGTHHLDVLEYSDADECSQQILSLVKGVWHKWVNGVGQKVDLKQIGTIVPNKIPVRVMSFNQLQGAETLIVKGTPYKVVEKPDNIEVPEKWQLPSCQVFHLKGKEYIMLCLQKMERTSLGDKEFSCHISNGGSLKESDLWIINVQ